MTEEPKNRRPSSYKLRAYNRSKGLMAAFAAAGGVKALATIAGVKTGTVSRWRRIPRWHLDRIAQKTGLAREVIADRSPAVVPGMTADELIDALKEQLKQENPTDGRDP